MRRSLHIVLLAVGLLAAGCSGREVLYGPEPGKAVETGSLTLRIGRSGLDTRTDLTEGLAFSNVLVIIANSGGTIIDKVYKSYPYVQGADDLQLSVPETEVGSDDIRFKDLKVGSYHVYVYANIDHTAWQTEGATIADVEKALNPGDILDKDRLLRTLSSGEAPAAPSSGMLLMGHEVLNVGVSENLGEVSLVRPVVRFNVYLHNHTPFTVTLDDLSFSNFNATQSYLLDHRTGDGTPTMPGTVTYGALPAYNTAAPIQTEASVGSDADAGKKLVYSTLLYENEATEDYRMFATVSMTDGSSEHHTKELSTNGVRLVSYNELAAMQAGDSKSVMIVCPTSNGGGFFGSNGSSVYFSSAAFSLMDSYESHALGLLDNASLSSFYQLTLTRTADGKYHVMKDAKDLFNSVAIGDSSSNNGEDGLTLDEGFIPTTTEFLVAPEFKNRLCRFKDSGNRYLYCNNGKMWVHTTWADRGNRMWSFYEVNPKGSVLKFIDNETAQVKPLSSMTRNQELNVVMNVYYEEVSGEFGFVTDNVYWTDSGAHNPSHEFK